jgi:hypothetical protein
MGNAMFFSIGDLLFPESKTTAAIVVFSKIREILPV